MRTIQARFAFAAYCSIHRMPLFAQRWWQMRHARRLIRHAYTHIHLYRALLDQAKIDPWKIRDLKDLERLPVMNKQMFMGKMVEDYTDISRRPRAQWYTTSGTSGEPFSFLRAEHSVYETYIDFGTYRFLWWRGEPFRHIFSPRVARIKMRGNNHENRLLMQVGEFLNDPHGTLKKIQNFHPVILSAYPSILAEIARLVEQNGSLSPKSRFAVSFGENLSAQTRARVEKTLGTEIYDRYGLEEIGAIGVECEKHNGLHVNTESVIVEILDERGLRQKDGGEGRIIATDLLNYNMPFIRYDTGDRGKISFEPCPCGVPSPRLWVSGRGTGSLRFGRTIHHLEFDAAMDGFMNSIYRYQIAKRSDKEIVVRIIPGRGFRNDTCEKVKGKIQKIVGESVHVAVRVVEELPITPRGKSKIIVDES